MTNAHDPLITEAEAGLVLGLSPTGVRSLWRRGKLSAQRVGNSTLRFYKLSHIRAYAAVRATQPPERRGRPSAAALLARRLEGASV